MDKVRFACPRCQTIMQTSAEKVGYEVACPECTHRFKLIESTDSPGSSRNQVDASTLAPRGSLSDDVTMPPSSPHGGGPTYQPKPSGYSPYPNDNLAHATPVRATTQAGGFCCPYCQSNRPPEWKSEVSQAGWIVFAVLLVTTCFFCFIGLFIRDKYRVCSQCKIRLG